LGSDVIVILPFTRVPINYRFFLGAPLHIIDSS
jgi:hypothetical protein